MKRVVPMTIDHDVWFYFRSRPDDVNLSGMVNDYLRLVMNNDRDNAETAALEEELAVLKKEKVVVDNRIASIFSEISVRKKELQDEAFQENRRSEQMVETIVRSDILKNLD